METAKPFVDVRGGHFIFEKQDSTMEKARFLSTPYTHCRLCVVRDNSIFVTGLVSDVGTHGSQFSFMGLDDFKSGANLEAEKFCEGDQIVLQSYAEDLPLSLAFAELWKEMSH